MSFKVAQKYVTDIENTVTEDAILASEFTEISTANAIGGESFTDQSIRHQFNAGESYYLRVAIQRNFIDQTITVRLSDENGITYQYIDDFTINKRVDNVEPVVTEYVYYEVIFTPNASYPRIDFLLTRTTDDYYPRINFQTGQLIPNNQTEIKRKVILNQAECKLYKINNIFNGMSSPINKIGIQGPPGLLMCINGEGIRIGPSGIYEIRNGYRVTFLGVVLKKHLDPDGTYKEDNLIIDYQYEE